MDETSLTIWRLVGVGLLVGANGFFVSAEFALVSIRRSRVEELIQQGVRAATVVRDALQDLDRYIAGTQIGITLASIALMWLGEPAVSSTIRPALNQVGITGHRAQEAIAFAISYIGVTFMHVVFGELIPKSVALQRTEATALIVSRPMRFAVLMFRPFIWALNGMGNALLRLFGLQSAAAAHSVHSAEELEILVHQSHEAGQLADFEREMLQHTLRFGELTAGEVMIPRPDMIALDINTSTDEILDHVTDIPHTRIPVYEGNVDQIIGILHLHDLYKRVRHAPIEIELRAILRPALFVPEMVRLNALLEQFRQHQTQLAVVIDEHGGTAGLVTLEDVVEEVFGELQDELESERPSIEHMPDGRVMVRGDVRLDEVNDDCGWTLEDPETDTIAGFVMNRLGRTARVGDSVETEDGMIKVESMARQRITYVALTRRQEPVGASEDGGGEAPTGPTNGGISK